MKKKAANKTKLILLCCISATALLISSFIGTTSGLLTANKSIINKFELKNIDVDIDEPNVDDNKNVSWGEDNKNVKLSIPTDAGDSYVRATVLVTIKDSTGAIIPLNSGNITMPKSDGTVTIGDFVLHFDGDVLTNWIYKDGYFYYKNIVSGGNSTAYLLRGITLKDNTEEMKEKYKNVSVEVEVLSDAIQAKNKAYESWGLQVDENGQLIY